MAALEALGALLGIGAKATSARAMPPGRLGRRQGLGCSPPRFRPSPFEAGGLLILWCQLAATVPSANRGT